MHLQLLNKLKFYTIRTKIWRFPNVFQALQSQKFLLKAALHCEDFYGAYKFVLSISHQKVIYSMQQLSDWSSDQARKISLLALQVA